MITRRGFLTACIATFTAPAIVSASSLMPVSVRPFIVGDIIICGSFNFSREERLEFDNILQGFEDNLALSHRDIVRTPQPHIGIAQWQ